MSCARLQTGGATGEGVMNQKVHSDPVARHSSGATVVHSSPFSTLDVPALVDEEPSAEVLRWTVPLYRELWTGDPAPRTLEL